MKKILGLLFMLLLEINRLFAQINIIPYPASIALMHGSFKIDSNTKIILVDDVHKTNQNEINLFKTWLETFYNLKLNQVNTLKENNNVIVVYSNLIENEKYELNIQASKIIIKASAEGLKNAFETLKQLMFANQKEKHFEIPSCFIQDSAQFKWRGMHLDVSRHFFDKEFVKKYIDYISMHKMNVFHWHLTDDQGWRIEIKKYPKLTEIGSHRKGSMLGHYNQHQFDTIAYGGFYTQEEIKEIVAYAKTKHVTIVPEIEMPGHALAALAAYPQYACTKGPFEVEQQWGVFDDVFCPKPATFDFLEDVLSEVIALFPGEYIHVGGDECPKERWKKCESCQNLMKKESLKDEHELQSYFIQRIEKFLNKNNKKLIGWDEILEGGLASNAAVMSWRGIEGGVLAAKQNHFVVMSPGSHCYFDHYQGNSRIEPLAIGGFTPVEKVYTYNPIPDALTEFESKYILGAQANIWTEYIKTSEEVEYAAFPRMAALAEALWTPIENKNLTRFLIDIQHHFSYLDLYKTNYSKAIYNVDYQIKKDTISNNCYLNLSNVLFKNQAQFKYDSLYLLDEKMNPLLYTHPSLMNKTFKGFTQYKRADKFIGKLCPIEFYFNKATGAAISFNLNPSKDYNKGNLTDGLRAQFPRINDEWLAWSGQDVEVLVNLGSMKTIQNIGIGFLKNENDWIYLPSKVEIYLSRDNINYDLISAVSTISESNGRYQYQFKFNNTERQFIKIKVTCASIIELGKPGAGKNAWLFVDEIEVD